MQNLLFATGIFFYGTFFIGVVDYFSLPATVVHRIIAGLLLLLLIIINLLRIPAVKIKNTHALQWLLLCIIHLLVQLLVLFTGDITSPFFILYHICLVGISLFFHFRTAVLFLLFSLITLLMHLAFQQTLEAFINSPVTIALYTASFMVITPLAYIVAHKYQNIHSLFKVASNQVQIEEAILANIDELVFVTDNNLRILSLNDAVEKTINRSRVELLHQPLFDMLFLKDTSGKLLNKDSISLDTLLQKKSPLHVTDLLLLTTAGPLRKVQVQIKPLPTIEGSIEQLSIVISDSTQTTIEYVDATVFDEVVAKNEALIEKLKKNLFSSPGFHDLGTQVFFITKAEHDIQTAHTLKYHGIDEIKRRIDLVKLCKQIFDLEKDFAQAFRVPLSFSIPHFGQEDIAPLVTNIFAITPEQFTGPFFTAACNVKYMSILIQKLLEVAILLSSSETNPSVNLSIVQNTQEIVIQITATASPLLPNEQKDLFTQLYGTLRTKTNLQLGSGLEGYLAKTITDYLTIPFTVTFQSESSCQFTLHINKQPQIPRSGS